jgi:hypothetical protein
MGTNNWTITAWVKMITPAQDDNTIIEKGATASTTEGYWLYYISPTERLVFNINNGTSGYGISALSNTGLSINDSAWHLVAVTADRGGDATFYLDGNPVGTHDITSFEGQDITNPSRSIRISSTSNTWNGTIDELRVYNRLLSPEEINASYNNGLYRLYNNFTELDEGFYNYTAYAIDEAGNLNITDVRNVTLEYFSYKITFLNNTNVTSSAAGAIGYQHNVTPDNGSHKTVNPCLHDEQECQTGALAMLRFNNTGSTPANWSVKLNQSLPSSIVVWGSKDSNPYTNVQLINNTAWTIINISVCVNCAEEFWVWANFTDAAAADTIMLQLNSTANNN